MPPVRSKWGALHRFHEPVLDQEHHAGIGRAMLGLQDQDLEHGQRIERRPPLLQSSKPSPSISQDRNNPNLRAFQTSRGPPSRFIASRRSFTLKGECGSMITLHDPATSVDHDSSKGQGSCRRPSTLLPATDCPLGEKLSSRKIASDNLTRHHNEF